jgi:3D (Asp-Asp-Asp) domain-containing protein
MRGIIALIFSFLLLSCGSSDTTQAALGGSEREEKAPPRVIRKIGDLKPSFYWIALEENDNQPRTRRLLDVEGNILATVSDRFYRAIRLEGTGRLLDGTLLNFAARLQNPDGSVEIRFRVCGPEAPYGYGVDSIPLVPFRSVAVDPTVVPIGSRLYIPAAIGALLPDGSVHDGYFAAVDIGDAIKNQRIDMFTSFGDQSEVFRRVGLVHGRAVEVFLVE